MKLLPAALLITLTSTALAQDRPRTELFAGYSFERIAPCGTSTTYAHGTSCGLELGELQSSTTNYNGWNASLTSYFLRFVGVTADFSGHYGSINGGISTPRYSFLFGPSVAVPLLRLKPFAHALFGVERQNGGGLDNLFSFTKPMIALGGGVDMDVSKRFALRVGQLDYEWQRNPTGGLPSATGLRFSGGVVFRF